MLARGMLVRTSYETGPFRIEKVTRGCTCPGYLDMINSHGQAKPTAPHVHLVLTHPTDAADRGFYWLNHYDEDSLRSVVNNTFLEIVDDETTRAIQLDLF